jgi:hypothetical protein
MRSPFLAASAALALAASPAVAGTIWVNDPALTVDSIDTIVFGAKYRLSPANFDQSLDSGGGTTGVPGGTNFLSTSRGNYAALNNATYGFTLEHRAGEGFIWSLTNPAGATFTQAWGSFAPAVVADQLAATLRSSGADGNIAGAFVAPGGRYNAIHLESRASNRANTTGPSVSYSDLVFTTPGLTQVGSLVTGFTLVPGGGDANPNWPDPNTDYHSQWFVADTDLAGQDWVLAGKVTLATAGFTGGNIDESLKFGVSGKWTEFTPPPVVPEPATWAMLIAGFGLVGAAIRRRQAAIA